MDSAEYEKLEKRYNVMGLSSISAFANINGRINNGCKDVYFLRTLGVNASYVKDIEAMDELMTKRADAGQAIYSRHLSMPQLTDVDDVSLYTSFYDSWLSDNMSVLATKKLDKSAVTARLAATALSEVLQFYHQNNPNVSESMKKNFSVKLLYWLDTLAGEYITDWNPAKAMKCVFHNIQKEQEFYFCYLLTLFGIDVLLLQNKKDIDDKCARLPHISKLELGSFGDAAVGAYDKNRYLHQQVNEHHTAAQPQMQPQGEQRIVVNVSHPQRARTAQVQQSAVRQPQTVQPPVINTTGAIPAPGSRELDFEELARLASSVVMIAMHDDKGNVVGTGSGIMIGSKGYILTNNHVASRGLSYSVRIEDDENVYKTDEIIKYNQVLDLAVIRIQRTLTPLPLYKGAKPLVRGQKVVAIGSPLGLFNSVSDGIIAGFRKIDDVDMIQFTAPISHGSSGGAVLNMFGEVIGISTAGFDDGQNINLAVGYEFISTFVRGFQ